MSDRHDPAQFERYAERILSSQDVRFGSVAMNSRLGDGLLEPVPHFTSQPYSTRLPTTL